MALPEVEGGDVCHRRAQDRLPRATNHAGACGVNYKTINRARALAINALMDNMERHLRDLAESCRDEHVPREPQVVKVSLDETALRFFLPSGDVEGFG